MDNDETIQGPATDTDEAAREFGIPQPEEPNGETEAASVEAEAAADEDGGDEYDAALRSLEAENAKLRRGAGRGQLVCLVLILLVLLGAAVTAGVAAFDGQSRNKTLEAAVSKFVAGKGATAESVQCHGTSCAAIINGQAYTVLVQTDANGTDHFGITQYVGH